MSRPLLFLDVDGPLNPYAAKPERRPAGYATLRVPQEVSEAAELGFRHRRPLRLWLNPCHGPALMALPYELCWATELPFVDALLNERPDGVHWKTEPLVAYANGRPFAWVDDEQSDADQAHVAAHHTAPVLLHRVNPRIGLQDDDFTALAAFAAVGPSASLGSPNGA
ncbi:hypothetical protein [Streptomyces sp. NPDC058545]|uniref:hypothetical protein n=1 Tax=Streptomyces sp. NPDC058545 TaxID=3346544 RepID=UPI00364822FC